MGRGEGSGSGLETRPFLSVSEVLFFGVMVREAVIPRGFGQGEVQVRRVVVRGEWPGSGLWTLRTIGNVNVIFSSTLILSSVERSHLESSAVS